MAIFLNSNPYAEGKGVEIDGDMVFFIRKDESKLLLTAKTNDLMSDEPDQKFGISGYTDIDCMVSKSKADNAVVFSLCDVATDEVLESVDIPFNVFFKEA